MIAFEIYQTDSMTIRLTVTDELTGEPLEMDGITWEAWAQSMSAAPIDAGVTVIGPGELGIRFEPESFVAQVYKLQVRGTRGNDVQTLAPEMTVTVGRSINGPAA